MSKEFDEFMGGIQKEDEMDKIMLHKDLKIQSDEIIRLKAEAKEKDEMIDALIDELEGTTKTDHTFRLIEQARELIFLKYRR